MIQEIEVWKLNLPLEEPYHLSQTTVNSYETIVVRAETERGTGWGETTVLENYSVADGGTAWSSTNQVLDSLSGEPIESAADIVKEEIGYPFVRSGLLTAIQVPDSVWRRENNAPVVGVLSVDEDDHLEKLEVLKDEGYGTIKIKIGFDVSDDAARVSEIIKGTGDDTEIRVDANQAYSFSEAVSFLEKVPQEGLSLVEQPLETGRLEDHSRLKDSMVVDLMLDEDAVDREDVVRITETNAADAVKLKMMKQGGFVETQEMIEFVESETDLDLVVGNGVQTGLSCVQEAALWDSGDLTSTGEFNGWLKSDIPLVEGLSLQEDSLHWNGGDIVIQPQMVEDHVSSTD